jgi:hypothetical protein
LKKKCINCYYYDACTNRQPCSYFDPIDKTSEYEEDRIHMLIDNSRQQFIEDWNKYIEQCKFD